MFSETSVGASDLGQILLQVAADLIQQAQPDTQSTRKVKSV
jgi:hypothetical protein